MQPLVSIKSGFDYSSPKDAFRHLNHNKVIKKEFNKVVEDFRTDKFLELAKTSSMPSIRSKFQKFSATPKVGDRLKNLKLISTARKSYRKHPKVRVSQLPQYEGKRRTVKMDPNTLRAGIARFILRSVNVFRPLKGAENRSIPAQIQDNPFTKIIQMPPMMGFDSRTISSQFSKEPPLFFWKVKNITAWSPKSREQAA